MKISDFTDDFTDMLNNMLKTAMKIKGANEKQPPAMISKMAEMFGDTSGELVVKHIHFNLQIAVRLAHKFNLERKSMHIAVDKYMDRFEQVDKPVIDVSKEEKTVDTALEEDFVKMTGNILKTLILPDQADHKQAEQMLNKMVKLKHSSDKNIVGDYVAANLDCAIRMCHIFGTNRKNLLQTLNAQLDYLEKHQPIPEGSNLDIRLV